MARILVVSGIYNASWTKSSFADIYARRLQAMGHDAVIVRYPMMTAFLGYFEWSKKRRAKKILEMANDGDIIVAHSFGCLCTLYAMRMGGKFSKVFFFGAAINKQELFPQDKFDILYNVHSDDDNVLMVSKLLPWHDFGGMGRKGYQLNDKRIVNVKASGYHHNSYKKHVNKWASFIHNKIDD